MQTISLKQVKSALQSVTQKNDSIGKFAAMSNGNNILIAWY